MIALSPSRRTSATGPHAVSFASVPCDCYAGCKPTCLPSLRKRRRLAAGRVLLKKAIDLPPAERTYYGLAGSATRVEKIFPPKREETREVWDGEPRELALRLARLLEEAIGP